MVLYTQVSLEFFISCDNGAPWYMFILNHLSDLGSNLTAPKNESFSLSISIGTNEAPIVLSWISEYGNWSTIKALRTTCLTSSLFNKKENIKNFWFISKNKEEPRYSDRFKELGSELEQPLAIARDIKKLYEELIVSKSSLTIDKFLAKYSDLRHVVRRAFIIEKFPYAEIQDNTIAENVVPIDMLRLKLSFFGALKFDPRSDKWLRICMFQGAPLPGELKNFDQQWVYNS